MDNELRCEACLDRPAFGLLTLHTVDGEHVLSWWSCAECADRDAPIHVAEGLRVSVVCPPIFPSSR